METGMWVERYLDGLAAKLQEVRAKETTAIAEAAEAVADALAEDRLIYVFGCGHSAMLSMDMFYRAGGLIPIQPIFDQRVILTRRPVTETTTWEQAEGWVEEVFRQSGAQAGDVIIIFSTSGRNGAPIDMALAAKGAGMTVIAITSRAYAGSLPSRHSSGKRLHEAADIVIDNHADPGDAAIEVPGIEQKVGPTSTVLGSAVVQALVVEAVASLEARGQEPPVYVSSNIPGGQEHNERMLERYRERLGFL
jgi:uncharacterized phosphosugar-binding protein